MSKTPNVPFFPGNQFSDPYREDFAVSHVFDKSNGINVVFDEKTPLGLERTLGASGAKDLMRSREARATMSASCNMPNGLNNSGDVQAVPGSVPYTPDFVKFDKVVLRYYAYFTQKIYESPEETTRYRYVTLMIYLADNTISINESVVNNSGIPQGTFLTRQPLVGLTIDDFLIGEVVKIYGREYHIFAVDSSTREFLTQYGKEPIEDQEPPEDLYTKERAAIDNHRGTMHVTKYVPEDPLAKYLKYRRNVLRFYGTWQTTNGGKPETRHLVIHYFLEDDTTEVLEILPTNSGYDPFPTFLRRQRLPVVHNFPRALGPTAPEVEYVRAQDIHIGQPLDIFGRRVMIHGCDKHTSEYLASQFGRSGDEIALSPVFETGKNRLPPTEKSRRQVQPQIPVHNGLGSELDSLSNCYNLIPKAPKKDLQRLNKLTFVVLRYLAHLTGSIDGTIPCNPTFAPREFIITYYLADCTVGIFEITKGVAGLPGTRFLERQEVKNSKTGEPFKPEDFYPGAIIEVNSHFFKLEQIDERSEKVVKCLEANEDPAYLSLDNVYPGEQKRDIEWTMRRWDGSMYGVDPALAATYKGKSFGAYTQRIGEEK